MRISLHDTDDALLSSCHLLRYVVCNFWLVQVVL